jgi:hypothetical protein
MFFFMLAALVLIFRRADCCFSLCHSDDKLAASPGELAAYGRLIIQQVISA